MKKSEFTLWLFFLLLTLIFIFFSQNRIILSLRYYLGGILSPVEIISDRAGDWLFFWQNVISNIRNIKESNTRLLLENLELYNKISRLSLLEEENALLREQADLTQKNILTRLANIIGRDFQNNRRARCADCSAVFQKEKASNPKAIDHFLPYPSAETKLKKPNYK